MFPFFDRVYGGLTPAGTFHIIKPNVLHESITTEKRVEGGYKGASQIKVDRS
jgi:hypothetical protein